MTRGEDDDTGEPARQNVTPADPLNDKGEDDGTGEAARQGHHQGDVPGAELIQPEAGESDRMQVSLEGFGPDDQEEWAPDDVEPLPKAITHMKVISINLTSLQAAREMLEALDAHIIFFQEHSASKAILARCASLMKKKKDGHYLPRQRARGSTGQGSELLLEDLSRLFHGSPRPRRTDRFTVKGEVPYISLN